MEILNAIILKEMPWYYGILVVAAVISGFTAVIQFIVGETTKSRFIPVIIFIIITISLIVIPSQVETGKIKYTVEITSPDGYKQIMQTGYSINKLFNNKEIYEVIGPSLE